ncbi:MAG: hypothetical protein WD276_03800 [Actinomycetota bacterium]
MHVLRRAAVMVAVASLLVASPARAALTNPERARRAAGYLASQQEPNGSIPAFSPIGSTADAVLSMVAANRGDRNIRRALNYLDRQVRQSNVTGIGLTAKVAMAAFAGGRNPRDFGGENLIFAIRSSEEQDGRYGVTTPVFDDALAMLALEAVGVSPSSSARDWLLDAQCTDGGWQFDEPSAVTDDQHCHDTLSPGTDFFDSDTNTTALATMALIEAGSAPPDVDPFVFFVDIRDSQFRGWGYTWGFDTTDANSTALVIQAYAADGRELPMGAMAALKALQYSRCGAFAYSWMDNGMGGFARTGPDTGATIGGILGLLRRPFPVARRDVTRDAPEVQPCP